MKKTTKILILFILLLSACNSQEPDPTTTPEPAAPTEEPRPTEAPVEAPTEAVEPIDQGSLTASPWQWTSFTSPVEQFDLEIPEAYLLQFNEDGAVNIVADCNNAAGNYMVDSSSLTIEIGPMTLAACPPESRSDQFITYLGSAVIYFFEDGNLYIDLMADGGTMVFSPASVDAIADDGDGTMASALQANPWQWTFFTNPVEQFDVETPENYVLTFNEDGTVGVKADCNNASGGYTVDGSSLTIEIGPMTMAACPEGSRSDQFVQLLGGSALYFFEDGDLYIDLMADGGTMTFSPASTTGTATSEELEPFGSGFIWRWSAFTDPVNGENVIDDSVKYTLSLADEGVAIMGGSCRLAVGEYAVDGNSLTLTYDLPEKTDESCEDGPNEERYFQLLQGAAGYFTEDGRLYIDLMADGGTLAFDLDQVIDLGETAAEEAPTVVDLCGEGALTLNEIEATLDPTIVAALDEKLPTYVSEATLFSQPAPGVSLLVITPEGRYFKSTGVADVTSCEPLPADALFEIGSNTKMMTSAMIYQLQEEGVLSTSDLIGQWLPEMAAIVPNSDQITIDMLLTHTNGIYDYLNGTVEDGPLAAGATDKDVLTQAYTPEELVQLAVDSGEPYFEPGAEGQWTYSNTGYILLGMIIEAATGKSYSENLQERIFEPLGLEKTFLLEGQPDPGLMPEGYFQPPFEYTTGEWNGTQAWSAGAVVMNAEELAVFLKALFTGALFQDPATLELMLEPAQPDYEQFTDEFYNGHGMFYKVGLLGHGGQALGFQSDVGYLPDEDVTIVIWGNSAENGLSNAAVDVAIAIGLIEAE